MNHFLAEAEKQLEFLVRNGVDDKITEFTIRASHAAGAIEAPRGTLYYEFEFDDAGLVIRSNIITPTVQNLTNIEEDANEVLRTIAKDKSLEEKRDLIEKLIRAYDPCLSCSTH